VEQAAPRLGVTEAVYRELEAGEQLAELGDVRPDRGGVRVAALVRRSRLPSGDTSGDTRGVLLGSDLSEPVFPERCSLGQTEVTGLDGTLLGPA
jgi:hypothetical protein